MNPLRVERFFVVVFAALAALVTSGPALAEFVFTSQPPTSATVGQPYSYTMTAADVDDDDDDDDDDDRRVRFIARSLPPWLNFDGQNTIFGTPGPMHVGSHRVRLRARARRDSDDQDFSIEVTAAPSNPPPSGADLAASVTVAPNPVRVDTAATWTMTVRNVSDTDVANAVLETVFSGDAPFQPGDVDDNSCSLEPRDGGTALTCRLALLSGGTSRSARLTGRASAAGEIVAVATATIADQSPVDANPGNNSARVVLAVTEGQSGGPSQVLAAPGAVSVAAADFNGDSYDDLAVASGAGEPTRVFLNDPAGGSAQMFIAVPISAGDETFSSVGIAAEDLDADGDVDIVVANEDGPNQILFNNSFAGFEVVTVEASADGSRGVAIADIDRDSLPDIVFANEDSSTVYRNLGNRRFESETVGAGPSEAAVAVDLTGDAQPELVFANRDRHAEAYVRVNASYSSLVTIETGPATSSAAGDLDGDGDTDLVFGRSAADIVLLSSSGDSPSFSIAGELGESASVAVLVDDFDLDGRNDVVSIGASGAHRLYVNDGATPPSFLSQGGHSGGFSGQAATGAAQGLFDAGRVPDVAVAGSNVVAIFLNVGGADSGGSPFGAPTVKLNGEATMTITVGDTYQDPGATAHDEIDGDLTASILVDNPVDTNVIGRYSVTYEVVDSAGNLATATRIVEVTARSPTGGGGGGAADWILLLLLANLAAAAVSRQVGR